MRATKYWSGDGQNEQSPLLNHERTGLKYVMVASRPNDVLVIPLTEPVSNQPEPKA